MPVAHVVRAVEPATTSPPKSATARATCSATTGPTTTEQRCRQRYAAALSRGAGWQTTSDGEDPHDARRLVTSTGFRDGDAHGARRRTGCRHAEARQSFDATIEAAVAEVVRQQVDVGIDLVSDGEMSKITLQHLRQGPADRLRRRHAPQAVARPGPVRRAAQPAGGGRRRCPVVQAPVVRRADQLRRPRRPRGRPRPPPRRGRPQPGRLPPTPSSTPPPPVSSPPSRATCYFATHEEYVEAVGAAMQTEYEAIVAAGFTLQLDCPDLAMARHTGFQDLDDDQFLAPRHPSRRGAQPRHPQHRSGLDADAPLLGQLRGPARPRHRARQPCCRSCSPPARRRSCSRPPTRATPTSGRCGRETDDPRRQGARARRDHVDLELRRPPGPCGRAAVALHRHRRRRPGDRRAPTAGSARSPGSARSIRRWRTRSWRHSSPGPSSRASA